MYNDEDDFLGEMNEQDPVDKIRLEQIWQQELEKSMRFAYDMIVEMGVERWSESIPIAKNRKVVILENMLKWHEEREEYEKCSVLKKGLDVVISE